MTNTGEKRNVQKNLIGKLGKGGCLEKPKRRSNNNISIDLKEVGWEAVGRNRLLEDIYQRPSLENTEMNVLGTFLT